MVILRVKTEIGKQKIGTRLRPAHMFILLCVDMYSDMCIDTCIDMCKEMCIDLCIEMDVCLDRCIDMCMLMHT